MDENYHINITRDLSVFERFFNNHDDVISELECAYMNERGYIRRYISPKGQWTGLQIAWIESAEGRQKLLEFGDRIKEKYLTELDALKTQYIKAVLERTPKHLYNVQMCGLQYIFYNDGWFILHCLKELVNNGKLKPPTEEQRRSLSRLIAPNV